MSTLAVSSRQGIPLEYCMLACRHAEPMIKMTDAVHGMRQPIMCVVKDLARQTAAVLNQHKG